MLNHEKNYEGAPASQKGAHESDVTQYSSESSESTQQMEGKGGKVAELGNPGRRVTRSKASGKKAS